MNQAYVHTYPCPLGLPHQHPACVKSSQNPGLSCLNLHGRFPLAILYMVVRLCEPSSPSSSQPPLTPLCPHVRSLPVPLYYCPGTKLFCTICFISVDFTLKLVTLVSARYLPNALGLQDFWLTPTPERVGEFVPMLSLKLLTFILIRPVYIMSLPLNQPQ